jgi:hypothetical protein
MTDTNAGVSVGRPRHGRRSDYSADRARSCHASYAPPKITHSKYYIFGIHKTVILAQAKRVIFVRILINSSRAVNLESLTLFRKPDLDDRPNAGSARFCRFEEGFSGLAACGGDRARADAFSFPVPVIVVLRI